MKKILIFSLCLLLVQQPLIAAEVNVYSARKEALIKPLLDKFTEQTNIEVNLLTGKANALIKRLEAESNNTPADVLITVDVARLIRAKEMGLFQPIKSDVLLNTIPQHLRDINNEWFGLSLRSRVIVYAPDRVDANQLNTYLELADPKWKNRICIRSSSNVYNQSLVSALVAHNGIEKTENWAKGLVNNLARDPKGGDRDQIKAVAAGACDLAVVNTYYLAGMLESSQEDQVAAANKIKIFWPNQSGMGTHMNVSGVGVLKPSKNKEEAIKLLEFLVSDEAQQYYADTNYEYSINPEIESSTVLKTWGKFKADELDLNLLGKYNADAVKIMDRASWK